MIKRIALWAVSLLTLLAVGCGQGGQEKAAATIESSKEWDTVSVATWNGASMTLTDYIYFLRTAQKETEQQVISEGGYTEENIGEFWLYSEEGGDSMEKMLRDQSLTEALHFATLYKQAQDAGTVLEEASDEEAALAVDNAVSGLSENPEEAAQLFLDNYGVSPEQMKDIYVKMDTINQYLYDISINTEVGDQAVEAAYNADPDRYNQVTVRHVLVLSDDTMTEEEQAAAKEKAEDILSQVENGADIGQLAGEFSEDPGSKDNNGEYTFPKGRMVAEFEEFSFAAVPGERKIVQTSYGYHVIEKIADLGLEESREVIKQELASEAANKAVEDAMVIAENDWTVDESKLEQVAL